MSNALNDGYYEVLWPRAQRQVKQTSLAPRLRTLDGKTIAQFWDFVFRGDQVFLAIEEGVRARFPNVRFVNWREFGNMHGSDERARLAALPQQLKKMGIDAAISAVAA